MERRTAVRDREDPRVAGLARAVTRLGRELARYRPELPDRRAAEEELAAVEAALRAGEPDVVLLRRSLLLIAGAIGSVSALAAAVEEVRGAVELFGAPPPH